jgi:hypothetical protein
MVRTAHERVQFMKGALAMVDIFVNVIWCALVRKKKKKKQTNEVQRCKCFF